MSSAEQLWAEAGNALVADPTAKVRCPENDDGFLLVQDVAATNQPTHVERFLICEKCKAWNVVQLPELPGA